MAPPRKRRRLSASAEGTADIDGPDDEADETTAAPATKQRIAQKRSLFVRSLPATATTKSLLDYFSETYPVKHATAVIDRETNACKGYGFVTFTDPEDAQRAVEELNNSIFEGRRIRLEIAEPRNRDIDHVSTNIESQNALEREKRAAVSRHKSDTDYKPPPKLIVRNLPWSIKKEEQLAQLFMSYGKVKSATIPKKGGGLMSGFGFVVLRGKKNAEKAIAGVNGKELDGRTLAVDWAVDKDTWQENNTVQSMEDVKDEGDGSIDSEGKELEESAELDASIDSDEEEEASDEQEDAINVAHESSKPEDYSATLFVRNVPFTTTDEALRDHFRTFGPLRYARVVIDAATERAKGTGFVRFVQVEDAVRCLKNAPQSTNLQQAQDHKDVKAGAVQGLSVLQHDDADPTGEYTLEGRVLLVSKAVDRTQAAKMSEENSLHYVDRNQDRRRLYLLSEGTISSSSDMYSHLSASEIAVREASFKQRKSLLQSNPTLHLSLTRLSVRNIPRSITSKDLKALAREAIVGFASDVKAGKRERLSKEELNRGGDAMYEAEKNRKAKGKGIVKQAKVVFESREGSKVTEESGAGRSRGYGFIEYHNHRCALMGLRWLNGHAVDYQVNDNEKKEKALPKPSKDERRKRLIVEFAIENAQVVGRRHDREQRARARPQIPLKETGVSFPAHNDAKHKKAGVRDKATKVASKQSDEAATKGADSKLNKNAKRQHIINKKRAMRREKRRGARAG